MKLISMKSFVLEQTKHIPYVLTANIRFQGLVIRYATFLNQPLTLGMFVPCGLEGNVMDEPDVKEAKLNMGEKLLSIYTKEYQQAKERVLFEGMKTTYLDEFKTCLVDSRGGEWTVIKKHECSDVFGLFRCSNQYSRIENLTALGFTLTPTAIKQIGL